MMGAKTGDTLESLYDQASMGVRASLAQGRNVYAYDLNLLSPLYHADDDESGFIGYKYFGGM